MGRPSQGRVAGEVVPFAKLLAMLATMKRREPLSEWDVQVYEAATAAVPLAILSRAVPRLLQTAQWFPTVAELLQTCEQVRLELRAQVAFAPCVECAESPGYRPAGDRTVERCPCWHAHQAKVAQLGLPAAPLALLPGEEDERGT